MNNIYLRHAYSNELYHHGIKGQKWGIRRFQNPDGSLTAAGRKRYLNPDGSLTVKGRKFLNDNPDDRENRKIILRSESFKGTPAERAADELKRVGFKDDGGGIDDWWLSKNISTKHGSVELIASIGRNDADPINAKDIKLAIQSLEKFGPPALHSMKRELQEEIKMGEWGHGGVNCSKINSMRVSKPNGNDVICELSAPVQDNEDGSIYGWFSIEFDPKTGKMYRMNYDD